MTAKGSERSGAGVLERQRRKTETPRLYRVLLINDDYTTMDFVVRVLEGVFQKSPAEAFRLMMLVHTQGQAACGAYTYEVAETKVATVRDLAAEAGFPLQATIEEDT
ncbi:MAG: ATP-dependent Clp protease adaptor ClpS [Acidobacteria bacterium]|nr:ATP-dependent Clp protease adaptor ClpS [Acidobacteriota bacterium]